MARKHVLKSITRTMTSRFAYGLGHSVLALACLTVTPGPAEAQPYTNRPTVVVDLGALDPYGYTAESDYGQDIQSMPVAPPGAPESLSPTGMNSPAMNGQDGQFVLPQFAGRKPDAPFTPTNRKLTKPLLEDVLQSAKAHDSGAQTRVSDKVSHDALVQAAVASAEKAPPAPASKPADIVWKESAFDDIIKPAVPSHKPVMDETASAALSAAAPVKKSISPFSGQKVSSTDGIDRLSVAFERNSVVLDPDDKISLDRLITRIGAAPDTRVQLRAYASENPEDSVSGARRLSLSRALTVRAYLMQQDVSPTRIDVRALGSDVPDGPADRVDLVVIQ